MDSDDELIDIAIVGTCNNSPQSQDVHIDVEILEISETIPALPEGKDSHLFVSYSSDDAERVWPIVEAIEKRLNLKCIYADRDFQPGMDISQNIKDSMQRSWKVLLMLSPNFTRSGWCKYEREFAFVTSMQSGLNCIIPVMLEECELPPTLVTITYIDATQPYCDIPAKVARAMSETGNGTRKLSSNFMVLFNPFQVERNRQQMTLNYQQTIRKSAADFFETLTLKLASLPFDSTKKYENGFVVDITAIREPLCECRPAKYQFMLHQSDIEAICESKIKLPIQLLKEAIFLLNQRRAVRHYDCSASRKKLCCWLLVFVPLLVTGALIVIAINSITDVQNNKSIVAIMVWCIFSVVVVSVFMPLCVIFIPCLCHRQEIYKDVHSRMWKKLSRRCLKNNVILLFWAARDKLPTLSVMRYNITQCQEYLTCMMKSQSKISDENERDTKEYVFELIDDYLANITPVMMMKYDELPDAPYIRHNVRKGKACICQCLEHLVPRDRS